MLITYFVFLTMGSLEKNVRQMASGDRMNEISSLIEAGIIKSYSSGENTTIIIDIGEDVIGEYALSAYGNNVTIYSRNNEKNKLTREIFNISAAKTISGDISGLSKYVEITNNKDGIFIKRAKYG
jgi:hypothetical protein